MRRPSSRKNVSGWRTYKVLFLLCPAVLMLLLLAASYWRHPPVPPAPPPERHETPERKSWPGTRPPNAMKRVLGQLNLLKCEYNPPTRFDHPRLLALLYGDSFDRKRNNGRGQIIVLGQHNSGTSIVTRLIMLLGAFQGNYETISINPRNKLKYYEQLSVSLFHDAFLQKFTNPRFRPYHGQDVNFTAMTAEDKAHFDCFAEKQIRDMNRHPPWVMKDPRMANTLHLWRPHMQDPICVFVYKDPASNSISLATNTKKSSPRGGEEGLMTSQRWLDAWSSAMENSLRACRGCPTIVVDSSTIISDVQGSLQFLLSTLTKAGVVGLTMPSSEEIDLKVKQHIRKGPRVYKIRHDLNLTKDSLIDNGMPIMNSRQVVLDKALQFWMRQASSPDVDLKTGADRILQMMDDLQLEESISKLSPGAARLSSL